MRTQIRGSRTRHTTVLGSIALAALLTLPMGCVGSRDSTGDPGDTEGETSQQLSGSFALSCDSGNFTTLVDPSTMRLFINFAHATGCKRLNGTKVNPADFHGRCFNDLSNRDGVLTCAAG
jgi:hypothetical protein